MMVLRKAFERFSLQDEDWMTWINAGDHLFRDAVETISKVDFLRGGLMGLWTQKCIFWGP